MMQNSESADRKCAGFNTVRADYTTRSYKMYKTAPSTDQHRGGNKTLPVSEALWKNASVLTFVSR